MQVLFDGEVWVHYRQVYVVSGSDFDAVAGNAVAGQQNGLCGAATPGFLHLVTGLHTGRVGFRIERYDEAPAVDDAWEEIVEASFTPTDEPVALTQWAGEAQWVLAIEDGDWRVRFCASGMDAAWEADTRLDDQRQLDRYLLQFWPAPPGPDQVLKQTSATAAYWHEHARTQPPPPPPPTDEEKAEAARQARRREEERARQYDIDTYWGGRAPTERLRKVGGAAMSLVKFDRSVIDTIADLDPEAQRSVARWCVHRAFDAAGLSSLDWVAPALAALDRGDDLPPPFDDQVRVWEALHGGTDNVVNTHSVLVEGDIGSEYRIMPEAAALPALFGAVEPDPLRAAFDALYAAAVTFGDEHPRLFRELREAFPAVGKPWAWYEPPAAD